MLTYEARMKNIRDKKIEHTKIKFKHNGYMDLDDNGGIPLPTDFKFEPFSNNINGSFTNELGFSVNLAKLLDAHPVYVDPMEILAGRRAVMLLDYQGGWPGDWPENLYPFDNLKDGQKFYNIIHGIGKNQHYACDFDIGLKLGFRGLLEKIEKYREINGEEKYSFYDAHERVLLAILRLIERHLVEIDCLLVNETRTEIIETLKEMREANSNILTSPPKTMLEVCQWLGWFYLVSWTYNRESSGFKLDQVLYPYYKNDLESGRLTREKAKFIIANFLLLNANYYQLSGTDSEGNDTTNELSFLALDAAHMINSSCNITIRLHEKINKDLFKKGVEYLFKDGNGWPRFSGDKGLMNYTKIRKMTEEHARNRMAVGCNWMALPGLEYPLNDCIKINVAKVFERAYTEMCNGKEYSTEILWNIFLKHLDKSIEITAQGVNFHLENMHKHMPELLGNLLFKNPIEKGEDMSICADFINIGVDGSGLGVVADSFAALQQRIEQEKVLTWEEVNKAIKENYDGIQNERTRLMLNTSERYCQGNTIADLWADKINQTFSKKIIDYKMPNDTVMVPGWFSWADTIALGKEVGATPDGRKNGEPITHGANPNFNFRKDGAATGMSNGIAMVQPGYGNTAPFQLELDPRLSIEEGGIEVVMSLLKGHVDQGGTLINVNILDKNKLIDAHKNPENYPELVVRVTGFTSYFMTLSPEFRELVVKRLVDTI